MNEILIRPIEENDLEAITGLLSELSEYAHNSNDLDFDHIRHLHSTMAGMPDRYRNMAASKDGVVVGFISVVNYLSFYHKGGTALINELVVSKRYRNQGIGRALVEWAVAAAKEAGLDEIEVGTEKDNTGAIAFYRRTGFCEEYVLLGKEFDA
jgi:ribosomal protein S18 acetylase RimI-like enzyme